jgi:hypothetical protein
MRKLQMMMIIATLALAIPFVALALLEIVYFIDYAQSIGGAITGLVDWASVAEEGAARWPELAGMIIGQLFILSMLLIVRRRKPDSGPDLFDNVSTHSSSEGAPGDQADPPQHRHG